jgi:hypothetical protein
MDICKAICRLSIGVFSHTKLLISCSSGMNVKLVKGVSFDAIRIFVAFAVVPVQSEETIDVGSAIGENNGKVE